MLSFCRFLGLAVLAAAPMFAQNAHWGVQGGGGFGKLPDFILDEFKDQLDGWKVTNTNARSYSAGLMRFHGNGSPSFSIQYSQMDADVEASRGSEAANGTGSLKGVMASKHFNFFSRESFSAGIILGGGVGKGELDYTTTFNGAFPVKRHEDRVVPMIEILAGADIRLTHQISVGPYFGIRNGFFTGGGAVRIHFR